MADEGFFDNVLDKIPGYRGYRSKESRRDTDRAIRDDLVGEYTRLADRLGRLATTLANERQIAAISVVDRPHKRLMSFIDRVRTATYGYAPLFSNDVVDERALDQLARFDEALADQIPDLEAAIDQLERADAEAQEFTTSADAITAIVQGLEDRFDKRAEVMHSGSPLPEEDLVALLDKAQVAAAPRAYRLHDGEAVAHTGVNYSVIGRVSVESDADKWRAFQLSGGSGDNWLLVSSQNSDPMYWLRRVTYDGEPGLPTMSVEAATYTLVDQISGDGEVIGKQGRSGRQPVIYYRYDSTDGSDSLHLYRLGSTSLTLVGKSVDPLDFEVFSREQ
jgi:hypothetical protein